MSVLLDTLSESGYIPKHKVLNALHFGVPQTRERLFIVAFREEEDALRFAWPEEEGRVPKLEDVLEADPVPEKYFASSSEAEKAERQSKGVRIPGRSVYYTNKSRLTTVKPYARCLRSNPSYNYMLVDGVRRFTEREMLRLQGFPEDFSLSGRYCRVRHQVGNSIPVPVAKAVLLAVIKCCHVETA